VNTSSNKESTDRKVSFILIFVATITTVTTVLSTITTFTIFDNAWAKEKIEGTEEGDEILGTPDDDNIDSKGGDDVNFGDTVVGDGSGDDKIKSGDGGDINFGDTSESEGSGDDKINSGKGDDSLTGNGGADKFKCGQGEDTVTDFEESEGDKTSGNCENIS
jgi:Ca2+-binding RTX toxin-like protein